MVFNWRLFPIEWPASELNSVFADNNVIGQDCLRQQTIHQWWWTQHQAQQVLIKGQLHCLHRLSTVLDHSQLDDNCRNQDYQEQWVVEEVLKHINLTDLQLSGVDLVEYLQQHEHVEKDWVVLTCLVVPLLDVDWWWDAEYFGTWDYKKKYPWRG